MLWKTDQDVSNSEKEEIAPCLFGYRVSGMCLQYRYKKPPSIQKAAFRIPYYI